MRFDPQRLRSLRNATVGLMALGLLAAVGGLEPACAQQAKEIVPGKTFRFIGTIKPWPASATKADFEQRAAATFAGPLHAIAKHECKIDREPKDRPVSIFAYRSDKGENLLLLCRKTPSSGAANAQVDNVDLTLPGSMWMIAPVWVELGSGKVYKCSTTKEVDKTRMTIWKVPVGDTPVVLAHLGMLPFSPPPDPPCVAPVPGRGFQLLGTVRTRHAREIKASNWSVGAETMDRDYTVYKNWREYLGPLGAKHARVQSGWAKTEKKKGQYDWAWMDEIIPDMVQQGVKPWMCLCYGNPDVYQGGGQGWSVPTSAEALEAWEKYVAAIVHRYGQYIDEWEIWNEPASPLEEYTAFVIRTAKVIRRVQPQSHIIMAAWRDVAVELNYLKEHDGLNLVNQFTLHPYTANPDGAYTKASKTWRVAEIRKLFAETAPHITLRQGENGVPSRGGSGGALPEYDWSEATQGKWLLRRLMGDLGYDLPSSYFSICDMKYPERINYKGLLAVREDKTIDHVKAAYYAMQRVTAIFDDTVHRIPDFAGTVTGAAEGNAYTMYGYRTDSWAKIAAIWRSSYRPGERPEIESVSATLPGMQFKRPVWVDLLGGKVFAIDASVRTEKDGATIVRQMPGYDSVVLIAEQDAIPFTPSGK